MRALLLLACLLAATGLRAQPLPPDRPGGYVRVATNAPAAVVFADTVRLGTAGGGPYALAAGAHRLRLREDDPERWDAREAAAEVQVVPGETLRVALDLPIRYRVESVPGGAAVTLERADGSREALGTAPFVLDRPAPLAGTLVASRRGYLDARATVGDSLVNRHVLLLRPLRPGEEPTTDWRPPRRARTWIDVAAGGLAIAAGAVAVHYKFRADEVDDRYRNEGSPVQGDPALKAEAERLDGYSAAALGLSSLSLGVLAVRLVLR